MLKKFLIFLLSLTFLFLFISIQVQANNKCFCCKHIKTEAIMFNCKKHKFPNDPEPRIICTDKDTGKQEELKNKDQWRQIKDGEPDCNPCEGRKESGGLIPPKGD